MLIFNKWKKLFLQKIAIWSERQRIRISESNVYNIWTIDPQVRYGLHRVIDDILITSESIEQHYEHIEEVLAKFQKHNVTVNLDKCKFFRHMITMEGIKMDIEKIKTIQDFKTPASKRDLQNCLGFLNIYRRYINKFAHNIELMIELLKK